MVSKDKLIDFLLKIHYVNNSPGVAGAFISAWAHGMEYKPQLTYEIEFKELCESVSLPKDLPIPKYPEAIQGVFKYKDVNDISNNDENLEILFTGNEKQVWDWCSNNEGKYDFFGPTGQYVETEEECFNNFKMKVLHQIDK